MQAEADQWERGSDTLDVWFDSGCSWAAAQLPAREASPVADLYLEGSDQHRGWFQASLLTRLGSGATSAPYGTLVTHGFVVDAQGQKMSKSKGNVLMPDDLIATLDGPGWVPPERSDAARVSATASLWLTLDEQQTLETELQALETAVAQQGTLVKELKASLKEGAVDKEEVTDAVASLKALKERLSEWHKLKPKSRAKKATKAKKGAGDKRIKIGADVLRLWVAISDWRSDVAIGAEILQKSEEVGPPLMPLERS